MPEEIKPVAGAAAPAAGSTTDKAAPAATGEGAKPAAGAAPDAKDAKGAAAPDANKEVAKPDDKAVAEKKAGEKPADDFVIKMPEGVEADESVLKEFKALAKEAGMKPEGAQKFADLYAKAQSTILERAREKNAQQQKEWAEAIKSDKEIGGAKTEETKTVAKSFLARFGSPEVVALLNDTGLGDHPEVVRLLAKAGKAIKEDSVGSTVGGSAAAGSSALPATPKEAMAAFYTKNAQQRKGQ